MAALIYLFVIPCESYIQSSAREEVGAKMQTVSLPDPFHGSTAPRSLITERGRMA